jgi:preprotein translocase subunit SecE
MTARVRLNNMNTRAEAGATGLDTAKLVVSATIIVVGIWAFYFFAGYSLLLRVVALLALAGGAAAIALTSHQGRQLWRFAADSRMEVRKVVWPTRQETLQTTLIVLVMVLLLGILLWLFDMVLMSILRFLTQQGV